MGNRENELSIDGQIFLPAAEAASSVNLHPDYVARLARQGKVKGKRMGKNWYVSEKALKEFLIKKEYTNAKRNKELKHERKREYHRAFKGIGDAGEAVTASAHRATDAMYEKYARFAEAKGKAVEAARAKSAAMHGTIATVTERAQANAGFPVAHTIFHQHAPAFDFLHKAVALITVITLVFGTYAAADPRYAGTLLASWGADAARVLGLAGDGKIADAKPEAMFAAAGVSDSGVVSGAARAWARTVDSYVFGATFPDLGALFARSQERGQVYVSVLPMPKTAQAKPAPVKTQPAPTQVAQTTKPAQNNSTIINQPVIERVTETQRVVTVGGITEELLNARLAQLDRDITNRIMGYSSANLYQTTNVYNTIAQALQFDELSDITLHNVTIIGGTMTGVTFSVDASNLTGVVGIANGGTATSSAPSYGELLVGDGSGGFTYMATSTLGIGAGTGAPGGALSTVQFNSGGLFSGDSDFTFDSSRNLLAIAFASSTAASSLDGIFVGRTATTSIYGSATSTFGAGIETTALNVTSTTATSTFANGIRLAGGCFQLADGTCAGTGGGGSSAWGAITGTLSNQTDLQAALDAKFSLAAWYATTTDGLAQGTTNLYYSPTLVNNFLHASTTIPKTYVNNTYTGNNTFNGAVTVGTLNGPLQANNGVVSATSSIGVLYGGTGLTSAPGYGQVLLGQANGSYILTATSSLGISSFSTTSADYYISQAHLSGFSTTSAEYWKSVSNFFSTTSVNYWKSATDLFSTTSANYFLSQANVSGFSTTSADYWKSVRDFFSTTSAQYFVSATDLFSTTSASYFLSQNQGAAFSTTSVNYWKSANNFFSTTSIAYYNSVTDLFSTTSAIYFAHSSTTIPKTYTANTFTALQTFNSGITSNAFTLGSLNGPLQANNGVVSATTSIGILYGGTGATSQFTNGVAYYDGTKITTTGDFSFDGAQVALGSSGSFSAPRFIANDSASNPGYTWVGDLSAGLYYAGSGAIGFATGGEGRAVIGANGNLGIGTTSPYAPLSVVGQVVGSFFTATTTATSTFPNLLSTNATTTNLYVSGSITGAGLQSCNASGDKLVYNATTGKFECGSDAGAGGGITGLRAQYSPNQSGSTQTFATSSDTNIGLVITSNLDTHTFTPTWTGLLAVTRGGTGWGNIESGSVLLGNGTGALSTTTRGNLTETGSSILNITGGTNALLGSGTTIQVAQAGAAQSGFLSSADWNLFNNKVSSSSLDTYFSNNKDWKVAFGALTPTTTLGLLVSASSTIGNGTQAGGLTINGGATTTGNAYFGGNVGIGTTTPYAKFSVVGQVVAANYTATTTLVNTFPTLLSTNATTTNLGITGVLSGLLATRADGSVYATTSLSSSLLNTSGDWTGTFDGQEGSYYLANSFSTTSADYWKTVTDLFSTTSAIYFAHSSTTIPKTYTANTFTALQTFNSGITSNAFTLGSLNGPLQANNGVVSATTSIGILYGGTGTSTPAKWGDVLAFTGANYQGFATSSLGLPTFADLSGYVPYTGATGNVNLGSHDLLAQNVKIGGGTGLGVNLEVAGSLDAYYFYAQGTQFLDNARNASLNSLSINSGAASINSAGFASTSGLFANSILSNTARFGATATSSFSNAGVLTLAGITSSLLKTDGSNNVVGAVPGTDYATPAMLTGTKDWQVLFGALTPTTTLGILVSASSTIGNGTAAGGLTINGVATTTGTIKVLGTGTSTFGGGVAVAGDLIPSVNLGYSLGDPTHYWKDLYLGPSSLYVNGKKVIQDVSNVITISTDANQNLSVQTTGSGNVDVSPQGSGNLNLVTNSGNVNVNSTSGNLNIGTTGGGLLNLGTVNVGLWHGSAIGAAWGGTGSTTLSGLLKGNGTGVVQTAVAGVDYLDSSTVLFSTTSANYWKSVNNFFSTTSIAYYNSVTDLFSTTSAIYFAHSSTTIPKTYTSNTFTALQTFANASSTLFSSSYASTTNLLTGSLSVGNLNGLLKATNGAVSAAVAGTDYLTGTQKDWNVLFGALTPTTTLGILVSASSTIGDGTQAGGLTINGGATTTGNAYVAGRVGVGTNSPLTRLQVGAKVTDDASFSYDSNALMAIHQTPTSGSVLNDPKTALVLARQGSVGQAFGAAAAFNLSRYENNSTNSRTRLDISLAHGNFLSSASTVMTLLSSGNVGIGTTSPFAKFSVFAGGDYSSQAASTLFAIGSSTAGTATSTLFSINSNGSTTLFRIPSQILKTDSSGTIVGAIAGVDYATPGTVGGRDWNVLFGALTPTTTLGILVSASSTIGNGAQAGGLTIFGGATTTGNLYVAGSLTLGNPLTAVYGGTGVSSYNAGDLLYADSTNHLTTLVAGSNGTVLKLAGGVPTWGTDLTTGGGGGAGAWSTTTDSLAIYNTNTANPVIIGANSTTTLNSIFEVIGKSYFSSNVGIGTTSAGSLLSIGGVANLGIGGSTFYSPLTAGSFVATSSLTVLGSTSLAGATSTSFFSGVLAANAARFGATATSSFSSTGALTVPGNSGISITDNASAGAQLLAIGDDSFLTDIDTGNTLGVYGMQDSTIGSIKLGSGGGIISGYNGNIGIGMTLPTALFSVNGTASTSDLFISNVAGTLLKTNADGQVAAAVAGVDYATPSSVAGGRDWQINFGALTPTTTLGILVSASSTIGNGAQAGGLTINGGATTTGNMRIGGSLTVLGNTSIGNFNMDTVATCGNTYHAFIGPVGTVGGDECAALNVTQQDANSNIIYRFGEVNGSWAGEFYANSSSVNLNTKTAVPVTFQISGVEMMRVGANGNVGIGTTSPYAKLSVGGQVVGAYFTATTTQASTFPYASTTMITATTASTTNLFISGVLSSLLKTNASGQVAAAVAGTDYLTDLNREWRVNFGALTPTTTLGILVSASSTIGDGTQAGGLTINGGATTTGNFAVLGANSYFSGNVGIGTSTPATLLSIAGTSGFFASTTATSTFQGGGINLLSAAGNTGCFAINGNCLPTLSDVSSTITNTKDWKVLFGALTPTTTLGILVSASSTIGNGTQIGGLTVSGGATTTGNAYFGGSVTTSFLSSSGGANLGSSLVVAGDITQTGANVIQNTTNDLFLQTGGSNNIYFRTGGSNTRLFIQASNGNVGIGTLTPNTKLEVNGTASSSRLVVSTLTGLLKANGTSAVTAAIAGTDYLTDANREWRVNFGALTPTTTLGILVSASSTIGNGTQAGGLTINGGATTTGNAYFAGKIAVGGTEISATGASLNVTNGAHIGGNLVLSASNPAFSNNGIFSFNDTTGNLNYTSSGGSQGHLTFNPAGSVGIGTTSPWGKLSVNQFNGGTAPLFVVASSTGSGATSTAFMVDQFGNVGIGTQPGPGISLDVVGAIRTPGTVYANKYANVTSEFNATLNLPDAGASITRNINDANPALIVQQSNAGSTGDILQLKNNASTLFTVKQGGNVGIGTTSPATLLSIAGTTGFFASTTATSTFQGGGINLLSAAGNTGCFAINGTCLPTLASVSSLIGAAYPFQLAGNATSTLTQFNGGLTAFASSTIGNGILGLTVNGPATTTGNAYFNGNLGIGSTSPSYRLEIDGGSTNSLARLTTTGNNFLTLSRPGGTNWIFGNSSGSLAIGNADVSAGANVDLFLTTNGLLSIGTTTSGGALTAAGTIQARSSTHQFSIFDTDSYATEWTLSTVNSDTLAFYEDGTTPRVTFLTGGNVGIGTTTPGATLSVEGKSLLGNSAVAGFYVATTSIASQFPYASTTMITATTASTTNLFISGVLSSLLKTNANGQVAAAVAGTDYLTDSNREWRVNFGALTPTTTLGILVSASSTIGNGTQAGGLTIFGGATTTGNAYFGGFVGIGSAPNPNSPLEITTGVSIPLSIHSSNAGFARLFIDNTGGGDSQVSFAANGASMWSSGYEATTGNYAIANNFELTGNEKLAITTGGNVGIGTTTPFYALTIASSTAPQLSLSAGTGVAQWTMRNAGGNLYFATTTVDGTATTSRSAFTIIGANGRVGIGTANPGHALQLGTADDGTALFAMLDGLRLSGDDNAANTGNTIYNGSHNIGITAESGFKIALSKAGDWSTGLVVETTSGKVGIGTTSPASLLSIAGTTGFFASTTATSTFQGGGINLLTAAGNTGCFAVNGSCLPTLATVNSTIASTKDWQILFGALTPTTTLGILVSASSTIGNGTQAGGLTISGGATTTGNAYIAGSARIGSNIEVLGSIYTGISSEIQWAGRSTIKSPADGNITLFNNTSTNFGLLQFGGTSSAFPALKRDGTGIAFRLADDSGYASTTMSNLLALASSTIGSGAQAGGLTINGGATTTGDAFFGGNAYITGGLGIGTPVTGGFSLKTLQAVQIGGNLGITDGSDAFPSISFTNDNNTGIFRPGTDVFGITTGGTERLRVNASGNVGIGTTSPYALTSIFAGGNYASQAASTLFAIGSTTAGNATTTLFSINSAGTIQTALGTGLVKSTTGILSLAAEGTDYLGVNTKDWKVLFGALTPTTTLGILVSASSTIGNGAQAGGLTINGGATTTGNAYFGGNVGIGTASPSAALEIENSAPSLVFDENDQSDPAGTYTLYGQDDALGMFRGTIGSSASEKLRLQNGNTYINGLDIRTVSGGSFSAGNTVSSFPISGNSYINNGGNVGIGTTTPTNLLTLASSTAPQLSLSAGAGIAQWVQRNAGGNLYFATTTVAGTATTSTSALTILGNGNIGVGLTNPSYTFDVSGNIHASDTVYSNNVIAGGTFGLGDNAVQIGHGGSGGSSYLTFITASAERIRIDSNGNLGIGTTSPYAKLSVVGQVVGAYFTATTTQASTFPYASTTMITATTASSTNLFISGVTSSLLKTNANGQVAAAVAGTDYLTDSNREWRVNFGALTPTTTLGILVSASSTIGDGTQAGGLTINGGATTTGNAYFASNVGIATTTPAEKLSILSGDSTISTNILAVRANNLTQGIGIGFNAIRSLGTNSSVALNLDTKGSGDISLQTGGITRLFVSGTTGNNVGIGTTTPTNKLTITDASAAQLSLSNGVGIAQWVQRNAGGNLYFATTTIDGLATTTTSALSIIGSSGNVGIGTTTPSTMLSLGNASSDAKIYMVNNNAGNRLTWSRSDGTQLTGLASDGFSDIQILNAGVQRAVFAGTGNVGIGSTTPFAKLSVQGTGTGTGINFQTTNSSQSPLFSILDNGNVGIGTTTPGSALSIQGNIFLAGNLVSTSTATSTFAGDVQARSLKITSTTATSTFANGLQLTGGCYSDTLGNCIGNQDLSGYVTGAGSGGTNRVAYWTSGSALTSNASFTFDGTTLGAKELLLSNTNTHLSVDDSDTTGTDFRLDVDGGASVFNLDIGAGVSNEYLAWATNNVEKMRFTEAGNLGIGTTTPASKLDVFGFINTDKSSGYKQDGNTILYASSTQASLFVGQNAGAAQIARATSTMLNNIGIGSNALLTATSTGNNTAVGVSALANISQGTQSYEGGANTAVGSFAGSNVTRGFGNSFFGYIAGNNVTTGAGNSFLGYNVGITTTVGNDNVAVGGASTGIGALRFNTTGNNNTAVGAGAMAYNGSATNTVAVGGGAGYGNGALYSNQGVTAVGNAAGYSFQTGSDYNTLFGYQAGYDVTTGQNNTILGQFTTTGAGITSGSNNILIGQGVRSGLTQTGSNQLNIGNLIFGTGLGSNATLATGAVGIGTSTPWANLSVNSTAGTPQFVIGSSTATQFIVDKNGSVGIGTTTPASLLSLAGTTGFFASTTATSTFQGGGINLLTAAGNTGCFAVNGTCLPTLSTLTSNTFRDWKVAFGALTPTTTLGILVSASSTIGSGAQAGGLTINGGATTTGNVSIAGSQISLTTNGAGIIGTGGTLYMRGGVNGGLSLGANNTNDYLVVHTNGNVGIGTTTPQWLLNPTSATAPQLSLSAGGGIAQWVQRNAGGNLYFATTTVAGTATTSTSALTILGSSGFVGIGTSSPTASLEVNGNVRLTPIGGVNRTIDFGQAFGTAALSLYSTGGTPIWGWGLNGGEMQFFGSGNTGDHISFNKGGAFQPTGTNEVMRIDLNTGNVGIGTTTPADMLQITGNGKYFRASALNEPAVYYTRLGEEYDVNNALRLYQNTNQVLGADYIGTKIFLAPTAGNVGIGTTTPTSKLDVAGAANYGQIHVTNTAANGESGILFKSADDVDSAGWLVGKNLGLTDDTFSIYRAGINHFAINTTGNIGIGTTTPDSRLNINIPSATTGNFLKLANSQPDLYGLTLRAANPSGGVVTYNFDVLNGGSTFSNTLVLDRGNVGIGTTSPYAKLSVVGEAVAQFFTATSTTATSTFAGGLNVNNGAITHDFSAGLTSIQNLSIGALNFDTNAGAVTWVDMPVTSAAATGTIERYTAQLDGNPMLTIYGESDGQGGVWGTKVGIGTSTPWARLSIDATLASTSPLFAIGSTTSTVFMVNNGGFVGIGTSTPWANLSVTSSAGTPQFVVGSSTATQFLVDKNGFVGIGTTSPSQKLSVAGSILADRFIGSYFTATSTIASFFPYASTTMISATTASTSALTVSGLNAASCDVKASTTGVLSCGTDATGGGGGGDPFTHPWAGASATTTTLGIGTSTPWGQYQLTIASSTGAQLALSNGPGIMQWVQRNAGGNLYFATTTVAGTATTTSSALTIIGSNGNVGIGTSTPWGDLAVVNETGTGPGFLVASAGNVAQFIVDATGNVGIGTTSPYAKLSVVGEIVGANFTATSTSATSTFAGGLNVNNGMFTHDFSAGLTSIQNLAIGSMSFDTDSGIISWVDMPVTSASATGTVNSYSAQIDGNPLITAYSESDGAGGIWGTKVGVGTSTPWARLSIDTTLATSSSPFFAVGSSTLTSFIVTAGSKVGIATSTPWGKLSVNQFNGGTDPLFVVASSSGSLATSTYFMINNGGKVGIGTSSPASKFTVRSDVSGATSSALTTFVASFVNTTNGNNANGIAILAGNNSSPGASGPALIQFYRPDGTSIGGIRQQSNVAVAYTLASDRRVKENFATSSYGLADLMRIPVLEYDYISDSLHARTTGFVAQDLANIFPDAVVKNGDDGIGPLAAGATPWSIDYGRVTPLIVKAVQELNLKVESLAATTSAGMLVESTTTAQVLVTATTTPYAQYTTSTPWIASFATSSVPLRNAITALGDMLVRAFNSAIYAVAGVFEKVITKELYAENIYADTVNAKKLCLEDVCVTKDQLQQLLNGQVAGAAASGGGGGGGSGGGGSPSPAPTPAPTPEPTPTPAPEETPPADEPETPPAEEAAPEPESTPEPETAGEPASEPSAAAPSDAPPQS